MTPREHYPNQKFDIKHETTAVSGVGSQNTLTSLPRPPTPHNTDWEELLHLTDGISSSADLVSPTYNAGAKLGTRRNYSVFRTEDVNFRLNDWFCWTIHRYEANYKVSANYPSEKRSCYASGNNSIFKIWDLDDRLKLRVSFKTIAQKGVKIRRKGILNPMILFWYVTNGSIRKHNLWNFRKIFHKGRDSFSFR